MVEDRIETNSAYIEDSCIISSHGELFFYGKYKPSLISADFAHVLPKLKFLEDRYFAAFAKVAGNDISVCMWILKDIDDGADLLERFKGSVEAEMDDDDIEDDKLVGYFYKKLAKTDDDPIQRALSELAMTEYPENLFMELQMIQQLVFIGDYAIWLL